MNPTGDVYRVAFDSANSELNQILEAFEELRARKERVEKVVIALKPLLGMEEAAAAAGQNSTEAAADPASQSEEQPTYQYQSPNGNSPDPFQHRLDQALGRGVGSREPRKFSRQM
jgi:hypothetical protein